jgi:hypothetical protein
MGVEPLSFPITRKSVEFDIVTTSQLPKNFMESEG